MADLKLPPWATAIIAASGWFAALAVGILDLPAKINSFTTEAPKARETVGNALFLNKSLSRVWSTEDIALDSDHHEPAVGEGGPLWLSLRVYNGTADGEVVSEGLKTHWVTSRVLFRGRERNGAVEGEVYDFVDGKSTPLAIVTLTPDRDMLRLKVIDQGPVRFIPSGAALYPSAGDLPEGELNMRLLTEAVKAAQAAARVHKP